METIKVAPIIKKKIGFVKIALESTFNIIPILKTLHFCLYYNDFKMENNNKRDEEKLSSVMCVMIAEVDYRWPEIG